MKTKILTYSAVCIALAAILSNIKLFTMPQGGTVTACSMLFLALIGYWFGTSVGIVAGVAYGLLQLIFDVHIVHPAQLILDYPLAFGLIGLSGLFRNNKNGLLIGYLIGVFGRFLCSFSSGFIFFSEYAPQGQSAIIYSAIYNLSYIAPEVIITLLLVSIPNFKDMIERIKINTQAVS